MTSTPRAIGTLIVVILKAKHLPNKRHIGKQSPYCSVSFNGENRRTKAIRKGGQHPEWDEEVRFTVYGADSEDEFEIIAHPDGTAPPPPPKEEKKGPKKVKGGTSMKLFCFADDPREPDLVGETVVDLTEVLTKGETDEWFTLMYKDKYAGEVYLELTFWSNVSPFIILWVSLLTN
jgi:Ca2+-dependent lipid-binding protein